MRYRTREEDATLAAHDRLAAVWDLLNPPRQRDESFTDFLGRIQPGGLVLDSGCATGGRDVPLIRSEGHRYVGIDLSEKMLAVSARGYPKGEVRFVRMDIHDLAFRSESFDAFLMLGVIQNIVHRNALGVLREHFRVLRPRGVGLITAVTLGRRFSMHHSSLTNAATLVVSWNGKDFAEVLKTAGFQILRQWRGKQITVYVVGK